MELKHCTKEAVDLLFAYDMSIGQCLNNLKKKGRVFYRKEPILDTIQKYVFNAQQFDNIANYAIGKDILQFNERTMEHYIWASFYFQQVTIDDIYLDCVDTWDWVNTQGWKWYCPSVGCKNTITVNDLFQRRYFRCLACLSNTDINSLISCIKLLQQIPAHWYQLEVYLNPVANFIRFSTGLRKKLLEEPKVQLQPTAEIQFSQLVLFNTRFQKHIAGFIKYI